MSPRVSRLCEAPGEDDEEFPDFDTLVRRPHANKTPSLEKSCNSKGLAVSAAQISTNVSSVRRRRLGPMTGNTLLLPWTESPSAQSHHEIAAPRANMPKPKNCPGVQPRKNEITVLQVTPLHSNDSADESDSTAQVTSVEEALADDSSEFHDTLSIHSQESSDLSDDSYVMELTSRPSRQRTLGPTTGQCRASPRKGERNAQGEAKSPQKQGRGTGSLPTSKPSQSQHDLLGAIDRLRIDDLQPQRASQAVRSNAERPATPPSPPKPLPGLVSPKKLPRIPTTPHHPSSDMFWSKDFVDDWNDEHSPKKQLFPDAAKGLSKPGASPRKKGTANTGLDRQAKKVFEKDKHDIAQNFLNELDQVITQSRLSQLAETTGGIKIQWTNKLNTTAGRANWKRETIRTKNPDGSEASVKHRHHASIELAEKVIDDEFRLLNVIAHEFCHLANFMVSGITSNPHGKEFKAWAAKCSRAFGNRGIEVTTKHSYEIDFKYVWECTSCAMEYRRHSKSINTDRHRCGSCKSQLKQTRPVPRTSAAKPSEYQTFMKEQMKLLKQEHPKSPQKEIMKLVADRWSSRQASSKTAANASSELGSVDEVVAGLEVLDLTEAK